MYLMIDGERLGLGCRDSSPVLNPASGGVIGQLPHASPADLDRAIAAAKRAFNTWRVMPAYERGKILRRAADFLRERSSKIATALTAEEGKTLPEAMREVGFAADVLEWYGEEARRVYGRVVPSRSEVQRHIVVREPIGPVAAFSPWNFPAGAPALKVAAALAAGCTVVLKPAEEAPSPALAIADALLDANLPPGALNVVFGQPAAVSQHLIASSDIRKVSFTGSVAVGKTLARQAADGLKRVTLELGGHAPVIVCDDADITKAAEASAFMKFRNSGQICVSPTRFFVHSAGYERFIEAFVSYAQRLKVGDGLDPSSTMGPCANARRLNAMHEFLSDARRQGAKVACGGERLGNAGFFFAPTVLRDVPAAARVMREEPFGPLAAIVPFEQDAEAVAAANSLPYGLAAYVFTDNASRSRRLATGLEAGLVGVNGFAVSQAETPFGGVKDSGYGSEGGSEGLDPYLVTKFIAEC
jgi:succinate-semialdehyde dehydrogenase / glutarate-semialdehyde dehydrogenase